MKKGKNITELSPTCNLISVDTIKPRDIKALLQYLQSIHGGHHILQNDKKITGLERLGRAFHMMIMSLNISWQ